MGIALGYTVLEDDVATSIEVESCTIDGDLAIVHRGRAAKHDARGSISGESTRSVCFGSRIGDGDLLVLFASAHILKIDADPGVVMRIDTFDLAPLAAATDHETVISRVRELEVANREFRYLLEEQ